jgi:hypothetical protein
VSTEEEEGAKKGSVGFLGTNRARIPLKTGKAFLCVCSFSTEIIQIVRTYHHINSFKSHVEQYGKEHTQDKEVNE